MDLEVGAREDHQVPSLRASGDGDWLRDLDVGPVAARGCRLRAEPDDLSRTQTSEHTEAIVAQLDGCRPRSLGKAGRRLRARGFGHNAGNEGARHERHAAHAAAQGSGCRASQGTAERLKHFSMACSATTSTGTASLKLDSDPLGSQFLNDSADALERSPMRDCRSRSTSARLG